MSDKDLKRLGRADLIDIIYEQRKQLDESEQQIRALQEKLDRRELEVSTAGSIAEAALKVNGVFEAAQAAADQYLESVKAAGASMRAQQEAVDRQCEGMLVDAQQQADRITDEAQERADRTVRDAEERAQAMLDDAERKASEKWAEFEEQAERLISAHKELQTLMARGTRE